MVWTNFCVNNISLYIIFMLSSLDMTQLNITSRQKKYTMPKNMKSRK